MKYVTLFGELLLFIPFFIFLFFVNSNNVFIKIDLLHNFSIFTNKYISFLSIEQIYVGLLFILSLILGEIIGSFIKFFFFKQRPNPMKYNNWIEKILAGSFPSLHSERTFLLFLFALYFTNYYIALGFFLFWLLIAYSRIYLKKHFWIDIFGGIILACLVFYGFSFIIN